MCRRDFPPFNNRRYIGDRALKVVHDLDHERHGPQGCNVAAIRLEDVETFEPDTLRDARHRGYEYCPACLGE